MQNFNPHQGYPYGMDRIPVQNVQQFPPASVSSNVTPVAKPTVLINPHFGKRVFINPNFKASQAAPIPTLPRPSVHVNPACLSRTSQSTSVHVNPAKVPKTIPMNSDIHTNRISVPETLLLRSNTHVNPASLLKPATQRVNVHLNPNSLTKTSPTLQRLNIHLNPKILKLHKKVVPDIIEPSIDSRVLKPANNQKMVYQSATKIIRQSKEQQVGKVQSITKKRRSSIRSTYKIVKSTVLETSLNNSVRKPKTLVKSKYKLVQTKLPSQVIKSQLLSAKKTRNVFKLDNRVVKENTPIHHKAKQYVYLNKVSSLSEMSKQKKNLSLINIRGVLYKKSHNSLQRSSLEKRNKSVTNPQRKSIIKSKYKLIRKSIVIRSPTKTSPRGFRKRIYKIGDTKTKASPTGIGKLRKCNIPCPYYRKFGKCKGKDNGKCFRKHDPGQIALCTKFLQGACIDEKCLLSHDVSPEKMPTCKFYLEGICSKDKCPYLHVRISPKADICRDFLEGYCKMATKCTKRHQLLCPEFEKYSTCQKQRCPYPHGRMVRKYSVFSKNDFAKKYSNVKVKNISEPAQTGAKLDCDSNVNARYYKKSGDQAVPKDEAFAVCDEKPDFRSRPKLGDLPSFIGFGES